MKRIQRRRFLKDIAVGSAGLAATGALARAAKDDRPNIVLIMCDDMGFSDIGCYGGEIETPNINRLAEQGLRFRQFYNNAKCGPTRQSLMAGLYPHQVRMSTKPGGSNCATIAESLKEAGYRTLMAGKWHLPAKPVEFGFDRYFGLLDGACNFFNPGHARPGEKEPARKFAYQEHRWAVEDKEYKPYTPPDPDFYTTDAFTDYAVDRLDEYGSEDKPFFLYVAYNAPHYPMHARPEDIAKYRGRYMIGWEEVRRRRFKRLRELGIIDQTVDVSPANSGAPRWDDVKDKDAWDLKMAVYAAMVDVADRNIGRIVDKVKELGKFDNTLFLFLSDNGGSSESHHVTPHDPNTPPGVMEGFHTVDLPWANASNTPFRKFKTWNHEGGVATPLIAHWPRVIKPGRMCNDLGHLIDIPPTLLDIAGAKHQEGYKGRKTLPLEGRSMAPILRDESIEARKPIFWQHQSNRAMRDDRWKLVSHAPGAWELYDMEADRTELNDLASAQPERVKAMAAAWEKWRKRVGAKVPVARKSKSKG